MIKLNWGLLVCGFVGAIVAAALPLVEMEGVKIRLLDVGGQGYFTLACLLVGGAMGAYNLFKAPVRWTAIVALIAFAIAAMKLAGSDEGGVKAGAGADGGMVLAALGTLLSIALIIKPGKRA